jgi:hypothetical protein
VDRESDGMGWETGTKLPLTAASDSSLGDRFKKLLPAMASPWTLILLVLAPSAAGVRVVFSARWALGGEWQK